jgi:uncharacterized membrane protein YhaH (DUF805 family)
MKLFSGRRSADKEYTAQMKAKLTEIIDKLDGLSDIQKDWLKERWLDQVIWIEGRANRHRNRYNFWRVFAIVGGILIPVLITMSQLENPSWLSSLAWIAMLLGAVVAIATSVEEFFHDGERWRNYRGSAELLKSEGWHFVNLSGPYSRSGDHPKAFKKFAVSVEGIIQKDVKIYLGDIVADSVGSDQQAANTP